MGTVLGRIVEDSPTERWKRHSKCRDDPEHPDFFPTKRPPASTLHYCDDCQVRRACLAYALLHTDTHGVWGGTDERQRRNLLRSHQADDIISVVFGETATRRWRYHRQ